VKQFFWRLVKHPLLSVGVGCAVVGYVLGVATSYGLPRPDGDPAPIQITVAAQGGNGAVTDIVMPDIRGLTEATARQALADRGVSPAIVTVRKVPNVVAEGYVVAQTPVPGTVNPDAVVISLPEPATTPKMVGQTEDAARLALRDLGADAKVTRKFDPAVAAGTVIASTPSEGQPLIELVELVVGSPAATMALADVSRTGPCGSGGAIVNGTQGDHSVVCGAVKTAAGKTPSETVWLLNRKVSKLTATVGIDDHSAPGSSAAVKVVADGAVVYQSTVTYGKSATLDISVANVLRLSVTVERTDAGTTNTPNVALVEATLSGGAADLATLDKR